MWKQKRSLKVYLTRKQRKTVTALNEIRENFTLLQEGGHLKWEILKQRVNRNWGEEMSK